MSKVYVTQEVSNISYLDAERYGEVHFLTRDDLNNTPNSLHNKGLMRELIAGLSHFNSEKDYIAPAGSPYVNAAAFMVLGLMGITKVKTLRWNNRDQNYTPLQIETYAGQDILRQLHAQNQ